MELKSGVLGVLLGLTAAAGVGGHRAPLCWNYDNVLDRHPTVRREFGNSDAVVIGRLASDDSVLDSDGYLAAERYHVRVSEVFKGPRRPELELFNENSSGRFALETGVTYLLFAHRDEDGQFLVNNCGNSGPVAAIPRVVAEVRALSHERRPPNQRLQRAGAPGSGG